MNTTPRFAARPWTPAGLLAAAGLWAYRNSFSVPFLFDDHRQIVHHAAIRSLLGSMARTTRPAVDLSIALNYALGGLDVFGYHAVNLAIHLLAGLALFGCLRRTLQNPRLAAREGSSTDGLALTAALIWLVHPLQTQSVTYIIQRAESLAGLCVLVSLYGAIRCFEEPQGPVPQRWAVAAIAACAVGVASKPVAVTAPLVILLYDRVFRSPSVLHALRARRGLYLGLAVTWLLFLVLQAREFGHPQPSAGFGYQGVTPLGYALTQPGVILHYLCLSLWPSPLVFDYLWPVARLSQLPVPWLAVGALVGLAVWAWSRHPPLGFLGAWWFLILAPTSSFIPVADLAAEHRTYLPLAAVITLAVVGADTLLRRALPSRERLRRTLACVAASGVVVTLGLVTIRRNADYRSERALWSAVLAERPHHFRALSSLGDVARREGKLDESIRDFSEAQHLLPDNPEAHDNLGEALIRTGRAQEAIAQYTEALRLTSDDPEAHNHLGITLARTGGLDETAAHFAEAIRLDPEGEDAHFNLANVLVRQGRLDEAARHYDETLRLQPDDADYVDAHITLGNILAQQGWLDEAVAHYEAALRLSPDDAAAHQNLGTALAQQGRLDEAIAHYAVVIRLKPRWAEAYANLGLALAQAGRSKDAAPDLSAALRLNPGLAVAERALRDTLHAGQPLQD